MKHITILDYSSGTTYIYSYDKKMGEKKQTILNFINEFYELSLRDSDCHYMIHNYISINL